MHYPQFTCPPLGGGILIAIVAITHVVIAHYAVGAGIFLAVTQTLARRRGDELLLRFLRDQAKFLVLFSFVAGVVTGVGIWFCISLVSPQATSALIHQFAWGWAAEWCFFLLEIIAGYVYYYGWDRLTGRQHLAVAWIYAVSAYLSLVLINGIISFMLTPGGWNQVIANPDYDGDLAFWTGLLNPSFWPSVLLRTISCLALAGIFVAIIVNLSRSYRRGERRRIINHASWFLVPLGLMVPLAVWYFLTLPQEARSLPLGDAIAMTLFLAFGLVSSVLIGGYAYFALVRNRRDITLETALLLLGVAVIATGSMEFVREGIRKPYVIYSHLYSNQIPATDEWRQRLESEGVLAHARFARPPTVSLEDLPDLPLHVQGRYVFNAECRACHEIGGTNDIVPLIGEAPRAWLDETLRHLHDIKYYMPPFLGTEQERRALVEYQYRLAHPQEFETPTAGGANVPDAD
ncbi:MAG TPA: cytochrome ubiquinol oxidase subunit I [Phycisphaerae bacterium]|nr:cytochrome ubiquinol oxidase subunit I [Phycisphaerae bacterium]